MEVGTERMQLEKTNCQVSVAYLQTQLFLSTKSTFLPSHQNLYQIAVKLNQTSLAANKEELNSHLRHTYRDKCRELAPISSLGNMSLCVNYPFLSNYLRNHTRILSNKTKRTACRSLALHFASNEKRQSDRKVL